MSVRRRFALWSTALAAVAAAGVVSSLPASAAGGNTQDVFMSTGQATGLSPYANIYVGVSSVSLQGGTGLWVVQATATVVNWGPSDYYRCRLRDGNDTQLGSGTSLVGSGTASGNAGDGALVAQITVTGVVNTFSGGNWVFFGCGHDRGNRDGLVDPGSTLWAHRSAELTTS